MPSFGFFSRSASDWRRIPFLPSHSFVFGERLYLEEGWGRLRTPTGEGPACDGAAELCTAPAPAARVLVQACSLIHKSVLDARLLLQMHCGTCLKAQTEPCRAPWILEGGQRLQNVTLGRAKPLLIVQTDH